MATSIFDTILAIALLTSPPQDPGWNGSAYIHLSPTIKFLAEKWEILDPREIQYILARPEDFEADLPSLQTRWKDLKGAPYVCDALRFPDRATVNELLAFNRAYRQHLEAARLLDWSHHDAWYHAAISETDVLYQIWDKVRDARTAYYYITVRRSALKDIRRLIGEDAYYEGCLPPHVPLWRFKRIE